MLRSYTSRTDFRNNVFKTLFREILSSYWYTLVSSAYPVLYKFLELLYSPLRGKFCFQEFSSLGIFFFLPEMSC